MFACDIDLICCDCQGKDYPKFSWCHIHCIYKIKKETPVIKKIPILAVLCLLSLPVVGCASFGSIFGSLLGIKAVGVEKADVKIPIKTDATAQAPIGVNNTALQAHGNIQTKEVQINDPKMIQTNDTHWYLICASLIGLIGWLERKAWTHDEKNDTSKDKYINFLEEFIKKLIFNDKNKES